VSRQDQRLEPQRDALLADGCERVFEEKVSSREVDRKALREALDYCPARVTSWWWRAWTG
jgi:DNA invertase Pin-like site-specific DNA recombinase